MSNLIPCASCQPNIDNYNILRSYLPDTYDYTICSFDGDSSHFKTRLRTSGLTQTYANKWLEDFQMHSKCTMRVERTYPNCGTKNVFKVNLRCQHNTRPRSEKVREKESSKNTDCPAKMTITIKRVVTARKSRSKDPHLPSHPTVIQMDFGHNHSLLSPEILKHRSVLPEVREKLLALFRLGHTPATALDMHRYDLLLQHGDALDASDRALLPDPQFCYRLFYKMARQSEKRPLSSQENSCPPDGGEPEKPAKKKRRLEVLSPPDAKQMVAKLEEVLCRFCESGGFAGMQVVEDEQTVLALCTPLMSRAHRLLPRAAHLVFVDAYGEMDEPNACRVLLMVTPSSVGPIPLGCLVSTKDTASCLRACVELWRQVMPEDCFHGRGGGAGPALFLTADDAEREALRGGFPSSQLMTALSHLLRATWNLVWDRKPCSVRKEHRPALFDRGRAMLFSQTAEELEVNYALACGEAASKQHPLFGDHLRQLYERRQEWCLAYRRHLLPDDPALFWDLAMVVARDPVLSRARTYNLLQAVDIVSRLDTHYERRLIDAASGRLQSVRTSRLLLVEMPRESYTLTQISEGEFEVHNDAKGTCHRMDLALGVCECRAGRGGAPCKHQLLVHAHFPTHVYDCAPPATQSEKKLLLQLATGQEPDDVPLEPDLVVPPDLEQHPFFLEETRADPSLALQVTESLLPAPVPYALEQPLVLEQAPDADAQSVSDLLAQIGDRLRQRTGAAPGVFQPALSVFLKNLDALPSDSALEYALFSFGKFSSPLFRRRVAGGRLMAMHRKDT